VPNLRDSAPINAAMALQLAEYAIQNRSGVPLVSCIATAILTTQNITAQACADLAEDNAYAAEDIRAAYGIAVPATEAARNA
jgi:hypothetical protein